MSFDPENEGPMIDGSHGQPTTLAEGSAGHQPELPSDAAPGPSRAVLWRAVGHGAGIGLLAGIQLAGLLFFLNPDLPFTAVAVLRAVGLFGGLCALFSSLAHLSLPPLRRAAGAGRSFPWALTLVLATAATAEWAHASWLSFYLPPGIDDRLIKAALWLTLLALLTFYTALLHSVQRRTYGPRSRLLLAVAVVVSIALPFERREAFHAEPPSPPRLLGFASEEPPQVLVVGLSSATFDALLPLTEQGRLPFFAAALHEGASARLDTIAPTRTLPVWTTVATGKWPYKHRIVADRVYPASLLAPSAEVSLAPVGLGWSLWGRLLGPPRPVGAADRRALPVWNLAARLGMRVVVIGWPLADPREGAGRIVPEGLFASDDERFAPATSAPWVERLRPDRQEVAGDLRSAFGSPPPVELLPALDNDLWRVGAARALLGDRDAWDVAFLHLPGLAAASESLFGGFAAVQFEGSTRRADRRAAENLASYYAVLDRQLGRLWSALRPPRLLVVVSAFGAEPLPAWQRIWREPAPPSRTAGSVRLGGDGVLLLRGDGVRTSTQHGTGRLVDVTPTLLYVLGFPVARDLDGEVLTETLETGFLARHPLSFVPSFEALPLR